MDITAIAGAAISSAFDRVGAAASTVASGAISSDPTDTIDISSMAVELSEATIQAAVSVQVLKVARDIERQTLDIFA